MAALGNRLVIGLDYGTTFSGVAFAIVQGDQAPDKIDTITDWLKQGPGAEGGLVAAMKVPSEISYSGAPKGECQWGYNIGENSLKWQWTKMELDQQTRLDELRLILEAVIGMENLDIRKVDQSNGQALAYSKTPEDIVADYLSEIREYLVKHLQLKYLAAFTTLVIDLVVSVPAVWSDRAKNRTCHAVRKAGFDNSHFPGLRYTFLMSEPEAAALYAARLLTGKEDEEAIVPGDCFVLCDAGGGTVDLVSYRVRQVVPSLELEEIAIGTGDKCGATFIDRRFKEWARDKIGKELFQDIFKSSKESAIGSHTTIQPKMGEFMKEFESAKIEYDGSPNTWYLSLPVEVDDDVERGINNGDLRMTDQDLQPMFAPSVKRTLELIERQVGQVRGRGLRPRYIVLAGGFGQSPFLQKQVREYAYRNGIQAKPLDGSWLAVAKGAVIKGCEQESENHIHMRKCRKHYGVSTSQPFSSYKHSEGDAYFDPFTREKRAASQMSWLIRKGDALLSKTQHHASIEICRKFGIKDNRIFKTVIVACDDDIVPQRHEDVPDSMYIVSFWLVYDLSTVSEAKFQRSRTGSLGQPYFIANLKIEIKIETEIQFRVLLKGRIAGEEEEICSVTKEYV
ncbi:hypothetical protein BGZ60DRAFT_556052 [Tricladium varicosporioides]|nr:hypothetical protein BGZ60DRAFT_556052 [Hymenoscyphus varicosporioides]